MCVLYVTIKEIIAINYKLTVIIYMLNKHIIAGSIHRLLYSKTK